MEDVRKRLIDLAVLADSRNVHDLVSKLQGIVPEYSPSQEILSLAEVGRYDKIVAHNRARAGRSLE